MNPTLISSLVLLVFPVIVVSEPTCVIQGICGQNENGVVPCLVSKEPHKFEDSSDLLKVLRDECPELVSKSTSDVPDVCCSPEDVAMMQKTIKLISDKLTECPACVKNIKEYICHFHCAPNQAQFLEVTKSTPGANGSAVDSMIYYTNKQSLEELYQTCSKHPMVQMFVSMSGCKKDCGAQDFASAMGMRSVGSPFETVMKMVPTGETTTVNGMTGAPVQFLVQKCADTNSCSDVCPF